jgi:hypothetical protein
MRNIQQQLGTWEPSLHLLEDTGRPRKPVLRWPVAGPSVYTRTLTSSQQEYRGRLKFPSQMWRCFIGIKNIIQYWYIISEMDGNRIFPRKVQLIKTSSEYIRISNSHQ